MASSEMLASAAKSGETVATAAVGPLLLPFPRPSCGGLGRAFTSAYASVDGREPAWTNFRLCYDEGHLKAARNAAIEAAMALDAAKGEVAVDGGSKGEGGKGGGGEGGGGIGGAGGSKRVRKAGDGRDCSTDIKPPTESDGGAIVVAALAAARARAAAEKLVADAGLRDVPGEHAFRACLDYVFYRNPAPPLSTLSASMAPPRALLRAVAVAPTPSAEAAAAECGALPSRTHPSDHVAIAATFEVEIASSEA